MSEHFELKSRGRCVSICASGARMQAINPPKGVAMKTMRHEPAAKSKKRKKKNAELTNESGMTRRTALKLGAAAGVVTVLTSKKSFSLPPGGPPQPPPEPTVCSPNPTHSPATTPFVQALPIPPIA